LTVDDSSEFLKESYADVLKLLCISRLQVRVLLDFVWLAEF